VEIRKKILLYFSFTTILLSGIVFVFIYALFAQYRTEEFQERQKEKIKSTLFFLSETQKVDKDLNDLIERFKLNELYNEKLLIFNEKKEVIYSSIEDLPIQYSLNILNGLNSQNEWYEGKENNYDVVGLYFHKNNNAYYGISKAYDTFGISKLNYLKIILICFFLVITVAVLFIAYFLSKKITQPLLSLTQKIEQYSLGKEYLPIEISKTSDEINILANQFNLLMKRVNEAFSFQKHAIHHISHELKTPISILVSNFEKMETESDPVQLKNLIQHQKFDTKNLSEIINSLLEIAKAETEKKLKKEFVRIDEILFDCTDELKQLYPHFVFAVNFSPQQEEKHLAIRVNANLLKSAFLNLMINCVQYSREKKSLVSIGHDKYNAIITFQNDGETILPEEKQFLFQHFFRGENSKNKRGFGLGLVYVHKIMLLHGGKVSYEVQGQQNVFTLSIPLL
jgi:signal transduction histidine kinase